MLYSDSFASPLGEILLVSDGEALCGLYFEGQKHFPRLSGRAAREEPAVFAAAREWLARYFAGEEPTEEVPLRLEGTPFQLAVWSLLREIPYGETRSYGELAAELARRGGRVCSARAVGGAVGLNPVSILVPCHRVIGADGSLTGYAGGTDRKQRLLDLERSAK